MRRLLDGNLPQAFGQLLPRHRVDTVHQRRWSDFDDRPLLDAAEAEYDALVSYIRYYNHQRRHSALGYRSPVDYERNAA